MKRSLPIKLISLLLCALTVLPLASCGTTPPAVTDPVTDAPETDIPVAPAKTAAETYIDGIDARVASILATPTAVSYTGTAYYVAADGDDTAGGLASATARLVRSGEGENWAEVGNVDIIDGVATVTFKAQTITTVVEE